MDSLVLCGNDRKCVLLVSGSSVSVFEGDTARTVANWRVHRHDRNAAASGISICRGGDAGRVADTHRRDIPYLQRGFLHLEVLWLLLHSRSQSGQWPVFEWDGFYFWSGILRRISLCSYLR